jgi:multidrug efflux system membrane fusion protein
MDAKKRLLLLLSLASTAFLSLAGCQQKSTTPPTYDKQLAIVSVQSAERSTTKSEAHYSAVIRPMMQMDVAFKGTGYIDYIYKVHGSDGRMRTVQEGDLVHKGTVLARIGQRDIDARIRTQKGIINETRMGEAKDAEAVVEAQANLAQSRSDFERISRLFQSESITKPEFEAAKNRVEIAEARVREAQAQVCADQATEARNHAELQQVSLALQDCTVRSPIEGVVLKRNIEEGSLVGQGTVAFTLADASSVKVAFGLPDIQLASIRSKESLSVTTEGIPGRVFSGRVTEIAPQADPKTRVFDVEVSLSNQDHLLKPGMVAALSTIDDAPRKEGLTIPLSAVVRSTSNANGYAVFVIHEQSGKYVAEERQVKLGEAVGQVISVLDGIRANDKVVTLGATRIANGQEVRLAEGADAS